MPTLQFEPGHGCYHSWHGHGIVLEETSAQLLRGQISALRGARNPHVQLRTFRFLCAVRLEL